MIVTVDADPWLGQRIVSQKLKCGIHNGLLRGIQGAATGADYGDLDRRLSVATIGTVPKPKLSAPSSAALITSRPVLRPPSACTRTPT